MTQVVSSCDESLARENRKKVEEGGAGAGADWGWIEGGDGDSAALPKGHQEEEREERDEEAPKRRGVHAPSAEWSKIFRIWNIRETKTEASNNSSGGNLPQSKQQMSTQPEEEMSNQCP